LPAEREKKRDGPAHYFHWGEKKKKERDDLSPAQTCGGGKSAASSEDVKKKRRGEGRQTRIHQAHGSKKGGRTRSLVDRIRV